VPRFSRGLKPIGLALTAYDVWRRLPASQRRQLMIVARTHGPRLASQAAKAAAARRRRPS
jgi:hypothetical protein